MHAMRHPTATRTSTDEHPTGRSASEASDHDGGLGNDRTHPTPTILIVDGDQLFAESVRLALEIRGFRVTGIATTAADALPMSRTQRPDVVLVDVVLPDQDGLEAGRTIAERVPGAAVVAVTSVTDRETIADAFRAGFSGYVPKGSSLTMLVDRIISAASGEVVMPREIRPALNGSSADDDQAAMLSRSLTSREREILALLVEGVSGPAIAERLGLKRNTVRTHVQNVLTKLQVNSRLEAAAFAVRHGLVPALRRSGPRTSA